MTYVASPDRAKYGLLLTLFASGKADILWEGHAFPYICNPGSFVVVPPSTIPNAVRRQLGTQFELREAG